MTRPNLLVASASLAATMLAGELTVRALRPPPLYVASRNPRLIYELDPGHPQINSLGMRQEEIGPARLQTDLVVATIGDSHTYSAESRRLDQTYPARLQHHLRALVGERITVLNLGVPGYNMAQELEVLVARALPLGADYVILQYCINDEHVSNYIAPEHPRLNRVLHSSVLLAGVWKRLLYTPLGTEHLFPVLQRLAPDLLMFEPGLVGTGVVRDGDPRHQRHPPRHPEFVPVRYHDRIGRANLERFVETFGTRLRESGVPGLATGFIEPFDRHRYAEAGLDVYSFADIFAGLDMRDFGYDPSRTDGHFSVRGSEFVAHRLAQFLARQPAFLDAWRQRTTTRRRSRSGRRRRCSAGPPCAICAGFSAGGQESRRARLSGRQAPTAQTKRPPGSAAPPPTPACGRAGQASEPSDLGQARAQVVALGQASHPARDRRAVRCRRGSIPSPGSVGRRPPCRASRAAQGPHRHALTPNERLA